MKWVRRALWALAGVVSLFWIGYEDRSTTSLIIVAVLFAIALGFEGLSRWTQSRPTVGLIWLLRGIIVGALTGAAVGPIAVLLALIKIALHSHAIPDFSIDDIRVLVRNSMPWIAAGSLFGAAVGFLRLAKNKKVEGRD